jgi:hypothetical protein
MLLKQIADLTGKKSMEQRRGCQGVEVQSDEVVEMKVATTKST